MRGLVLNGFTIKNKFASGGMAHIYYAENKLGIPAAIKVLKKNFAEEKSIHDRFQQEAKIMVGLNHSNIVKVYDIGEIEGQPAIIMEYLEGSTLRDKIGNKPLDHARAMKYFKQCVEAMAYAHQKGVIHRDIKPSNIFITKNNEVKIIDFGIARHRESRSHTVTGQTLGTVLYMSPEQVKDPKRVTEKTDVYSLGVTFYHALTGKAPYDMSTDSQYAIQTKIVNKELSIQRLSDEWQEVLTKCLIKDPDNRDSITEISRILYSKNSFIDNKSSIMESQGPKTINKEKSKSISNAKVEINTDENPKTDHTILASKDSKYSSRALNVNSISLVNLLSFFVISYLMAIYFAIYPVSDSIGIVFNLQLFLPFILFLIANIIFFKIDLFSLTHKFKAGKWYLLAVVIIYFLAPMIIYGDVSQIFLSRYEVYTLGFLYVFLYEIFYRGIIHESLQSKYTYWISTLIGSVLYFIYITITNSPIFHFPLALLIVLCVCFFYFMLQNYIYEFSGKPLSWNVITGLLFYSIIFNFESFYGYFVDPFQYLFWSYISSRDLILTLTFGAIFVAISFILYIIKSVPIEKKGVDF